MTNYKGYEDQCYFNQYCLLVGSLLYIYCSEMVSADICVCGAERAYPSVVGTPAEVGRRTNVYLTMLSIATLIQSVPLDTEPGISLIILPLMRIHSFIHQYSALEAGVAGTRAQSCDRCGSGKLHPGQVLGGSLPLLSPAFRSSHFRRQVPVRPQRRERSQQRKVELWVRNLSGNFA